MPRINYVGLHQPQRNRLNSTYQFHELRALKRADAGPEESIQLLHSSRNGCNRTCLSAIVEAGGGV